MLENDMDVKTFLKNSRLCHYVDKCIGESLISDRRVESLKKPLMEAVRTAILHAFPSKNVKLNIAEAQTMAGLYLDELTKADDDNSLSHSGKYMKAVLLQNPRGAFSVFVDFYIKQFDLDDYTCKSVRQMILYYVKTFSDMYPISAWQTHMYLFTEAKGLRYLSDLFYECGCDINKLSEVLPLKPHVLVHSKMLQETIVSLFEDKKRSISERVTLLNTVFSSDKLSVLFMKVLPRAISPLLESLHPDQEVSIKRTIRNVALTYLKDPRINGYDKAPWSEVSEDGKRRFRELLARDDLDFFFDVAQKLDSSKMWDERKEFWEQYIPYMSDTKAFFCSSGFDIFYVRELVQEYCTKNDFVGIDHGWVQSYQHKCAFMFLINGYLIVEWTSNGRVTFLPYNEDARGLFKSQSYTENQLKDCVKYYAAIEPIGHLGRRWKERVKDVMRNTVGVYIE